jgi:hypothetical protein
VQPNKTTMHITLSIQNILTVSFILLIFAPLPVLILSAPLGYMRDWIKYRSYRRVVERHYSDLDMVDVEKLKNIFPHKDTNQLESIANFLNDK